MRVKDLLIAKNKPRKRRRWWLYCVIGCFVLVFGTVGAFALRTWWMDRQIRAELARIRAAGEPLSAEDLDAMYRLPPGVPDATEQWVRALEPLDEDDYKQHIRGFPIVDPSVEEAPVPGEHWPQIEEAQALLAYYGESVALIQQAAGSGGGARYSIEFYPGILAGEDHLQRIRRASYLVRLDANVRAHRGDWSGSAKSLDALFVLGRSIEHEPLMFSFLIRLACDRGAVNEIRRLLPVGGFADNDLQGFQRALRAIDYRRNVHRALIGERVGGLEIFDDRSMTTEILQSEWNVPEMDVTHGAASVWWSLFWRDDCLAYLEFFRELAAAAQLGWPEAARRGDCLVAENRANLGVRHLVTVVLSGPSERLVHGAVLNTGWMRAGDAAIAVELHRRRKGKLPETLEQLVPEFLPEVPADPFDGKPLRYIVGDDAYLIYSVGYDFVDDGGEGDDRGEPDLVFRVQRRGTNRPNTSSD